MPRLLTGIEWLDRLHLRPMPRKTKHLTVTVDGDEREATWKKGVGIYVDGHDFGKGDTVEIKRPNSPHFSAKFETSSLQTRSYKSLRVSLVLSAPSRRRQIRTVRGREEN